MELPARFVEMLDSMAGFEGAAEALATTDPEVAIRFNPAKVGPGFAVPDHARVPWEPMGKYVADRPAFTFDPAMYFGQYYVQDPSSMIVGEAVRRIVARIGDRPLRYLDACAAPGGKSTSALANLPAGSFVLANEYEASRVDALVDNLARWGSVRYAVCRTDARRLADLGPLFDIVGADVPCSGEGMMRKNETAVAQWSPRLVESCAALQRQIVEAVWRSLRPGGYLIYSTCTFNTAENEDNVRYFIRSLEAEPVDLGLDVFDGVIGAVGADLPAARFIPGRVRGEGQFVAVLRKPSGDVAEPRLAPAKRTVTLPFALDGDFVGMAAKNGDIYGVASDVASLVRYLTSKTNIIVPGIHLATPRGRDFVPAHPLASSLALDRTAFAAADVDYTTAITFLRGEALRLDSSVPRGIVLLSYDDIPLGFVKNIGNRANSLLPANRRIRSSHVPASPPRV